MKDQIDAAEKMVKQIEAKVKKDQETLDNLTEKDPVKEAELAALKAKLTKYQRAVKDLKVYDAKLDKELGKCPAGSKDTWCKKLT